MATPAIHIKKPSDSRVVVLDAFVPVPRGSSFSAPPPLNWAAKDPRDALDYQIDISPVVIGDDGDTINTVDVSVVPSGAGDLAVVSSAVDGNRIIVWLSGGRPKVIYNVTVEMTTTNGRALQISILLPVIPLSSPEVPAGSIEISSGIILTDHNGNPVLAVP